MSNYLIHHGIKGQKKGIRRFQYEDGSLTPEGRARYGYNSESTIKKGTTFESIENKHENVYDLAEKEKNWKYVYNPRNSWDSQVYRGPFAAYKNMYTPNGKYGQQVSTYSVKKDLKLASQKERYGEFKNLLSEYGKVTINDLSSVQQAMIKYNYGMSDPDQNKRVRSVDLNHLKTKEDYDAAYKIFNTAMEDIQAFKSTKRYSEIMAKKYDAMIDDNNKEVYNEAIEPLIIFSRKNLERISIRNLDPEEIRKNYSAVKTEMVKKGKKVSL